MSVGDRKVVEYVKRVQDAQRASGKALGIILAGHNGSGKSTFWYRRLADTFKIPLINADRMMMSILPEVRLDGNLPAWASAIRDEDESWARVAQKGVEGFVAQAMNAKIPFARETVFSYWEPQKNGKVLSKIDQIEEMQRYGYFVLLIFVGLSDWQLSAARVATRFANGGHQVPAVKLPERFPRTQQAIRVAASVADATIMVDNSRTEDEAFTLCRVQLREQVEFDLRTQTRDTPKAISAWLDVVSPL